MTREQFSSQEEWYFSWWIDELIEKGFIRKAIYQPESYMLSEEAEMHLGIIKKGKPVKCVKKILNQHIYTADWEILWSETAYEVFVKPLKYLADKEDSSYFVFCKNEIDCISSVIDIKGSFNGPSNTSAATFPLNQKWLYDKYRIYVQKVIPLYYTKNKQGKRIPHGLFSDTFTPERFLVQDERINVKRTIHYEPRSLADYLKSI